MKRNVSLQGMMAIVLAFGAMFSGCMSTGIGKPTTDSFSGITKQVATLTTDGMYRYVKIQKASKAGTSDVYMIFAKNNDSGDRYLALNIDGGYIEVPEVDVDFDVSSSKYGVVTFRIGSFRLTEELRQKLLGATTISARYQQEILGVKLENKIPMDELRAFLQ